MEIKFYVLIAFGSASKDFIEWIRSTLYRLNGVSGHVTSNKTADFWQLKYAKKESSRILSEMYRNDESFFLSRKRLKINRVLAMIGMPRI
jgi:hypothetical protein